jgi:hypothetical protein
MTHPTDAELMASIRGLWETLDPPPADLADGVLAALAATDLELEYELLTLVERTGLPSGVRGAESAAATGPWTLEYTSETCHLLVRISTVDDVRRVDGWVVPAVPMTVGLTAATEGSEVVDQEAEVDEHGRFEFTAPGSGQASLWFLPVHPDAPGAPRPFATPAFLI